MWFIHETDCSAAVCAISHFTFHPLILFIVRSIFFSAVSNNVELRYQLLPLQDSLTMSSTSAGSFYYFAYVTYVDPDVLKRSLAEVPEAAVPTILRSHPALLPSYRLVCDAISAEGPRLGRLNITPYSLIPRNPTTKLAYHVRNKSTPCGSNDSQEYVTAFCDGVRGILYELPASMRMPLLQAVAREGSFNMYATLSCYELSDVRRGVRNPDAASHEAIVIAALDLPLMEHKYLIEPTMKLRWKALPPPQGVAAPPGLTSSALSPQTRLAADAVKDAKNEDHDNDSHNSHGGDGRRESGGAGATGGTNDAAAFRWPGLHWCNCINSVRVAPSCAYVATIQHAYKTYLLLPTATEEDAEGREKPQGGGAGDGVSYGQAIYGMVYLQARDVAKDAMEAKTWYLAYGSNLSWEQVCLRIGPPYQRRAVKLPDYVLVANKTPLDRVEYASFGYYNVEPVEVRRRKEVQGIVQHHNTMPSYVCGAAYEISMAQLEMMDRYETGYDRELLRCTDLRDPAAAPWDCWTYIAQETSEALLPSREYLSRVLEGSDILPLEYMEGIRATPTNPLRSPRQDQRLRKEI
jgi:hypothetical protein